ncbi:MAG: pantetheine-phosphate adenylyltransferase [Bdellovibrionaceae bacterium]|nr:pantetheine-phosphate adenylyltransferase [Pseudobdellovibrionaceae bacterium]NUM59423.1 pantetheine-phosphate adenylyltransferase [Pseudobdellovibrionaceae bacterium]
MKKKSLNQSYSKKNRKKTISRVIYPGSFDPITMGHVDIITRLSKSFDEVVVLVANNAQKNFLFSAEERKGLIIEAVKGYHNISVDIFDGLTVNYMKKHGIDKIVRGLRAVVDFEYEMTMANINRKLEPEIETLLVFASPEYYYISSRSVKEVALNGGSLRDLVPSCVKKPLLKKLQLIKEKGHYVIPKST